MSDLAPQYKSTVYIYISVIENFSSLAIVAEMQG
jgi:hypothetical protein